MWSWPFLTVFTMQKKARSKSCLWKGDEKKKVEGRGTSSGENGELNWLLVEEVFEAKKVEKEQTMEPKKFKN